MLDEKYCLRPEDLKEISTTEDAQRFIDTVCKAIKETIGDKSVIAVVEPRNLNEICLIGIELQRYAVPDNMHIFVLDSGLCSKERVRKVEQYFIDKGIDVTDVEEAGAAIARYVKKGKAYWPYAIGDLLVKRYNVRENYAYEAVFSDQEYEKSRGSNLLRHIHSDTLTGCLKRITPTGWLYESELPFVVKALKIDTSLCSKRSFKEGKFYMSNFYPARIEIKEGDMTYVFPSAENYYQACKAETIIEKQMMSDLTPNSAKELGAKILNVSWDKETKLAVMRKVIEAKFTQNIELMEQLLSEDDENLAEIGDDDTFWGIIKEESGELTGENNLGRLLLELKEKYKGLSMRDIIQMNKHKDIYVHHMRLNKGPFEKIKDGKKKIEVRCYDDKRRKLKEGDYVVFHRTDDEKDTIVVIVKGLHVCDTFVELYSKFAFADFGCEGSNMDQILRSIRQIYSEEKESKYGAVGIEIEVIKNDMTDSRSQ